jgi:hypothetical protein
MAETASIAGEIRIPQGLGAGPMLVIVAGAERIVCRTPRSTHPPNTTEIPAASNLSSPPGAGASPNHGKISSSVSCDGAGTPGCS